jgi:Tol biopolymer transport system component/predicted Ser/Thr protein kinase
MLGRTLGHYAIVEKLGEGGMGAVYKALDTRLERYVALKILPAGQMSDPDRRRRFAQEAKSASALNHPNIVTIYDIGETEGVYYIAMEYVAGRPLEDLVGGKGLPLREALGLAIQIADGLGKAHAAGIVHRDLKPSNIMVTPDGLVKILDFGLAKLVESPVPAADQGATMTSPRSPATEEGVILGTVSYMSPEQAAGKPVDARSDIFSFGSVLYEMLTGRRAFEGETKVSTLAAVIATDPAPPQTSRGPLPPEVERVVMRALRKDPQRRWQTMADLKVALQDLKDDSESGRLTAALPAPSRPPRRTWLAAGLVGLAVLAAGGIVAWRVLKPRPAGPGTVKPERITYEPGFTFWPAIAADGTMIAYSVDLGGNVDVYVRQLNGRQSIRRTDDPAPDWLANFSPDGSRIVFRSERDGGGLYLMESLAGPERRIADEGTMPAFSPDGSTIAYLVSDPMSRLARLFAIPAAGGPPRPLAPGFLAVPRGASWSPPLWSEDGRTVLLDGMKEGDGAGRAWWLVPLDGGPAVAVKPPPETGRFVRVICAWRNGEVYYADGSTIGGMTMFRVPLATGARPELGQPEVVTSPAGMLWGASIAEDGRMVFSTMSPSINVWAVPISPATGAASGAPEPVTSDPLGKMAVAASSDGSRLAWTAYSTEQCELHVRDVRSGREDAIQVSGKTLALFPCLSPDGSRLFYSDVVDGRRTSFIVERGGARRSWTGQGIVAGFFADSRHVLASAGDAVFRADEAGNDLGVVVDTTGAGGLYSVALSPTGREVAFVVSHPDGSVSLYAAPVGDRPSARASWMELETGRHYIASPSWSRDGRTLFYVSNRDDFFCVWAQRFSADGRPTGQPFAAFHDHRPPDMKMYRMGVVSAAADRLYMLLAEFKGDLWSFALPR